MGKAIFLILATSLVALQTPSSDAFLLEAIGHVVTLNDFGDLISNLVKSTTSHTEEAQEKDDTSKLLKQVTKNLEDLKEVFGGNITDVIKQIKKVPTEISSTSDRTTIQKLVGGIIDAFKILVKKQIKYNKKPSKAVSNSDVNTAAIHETDLQKDWLNLQRALLDGNIVSCSKKTESKHVCDSGPPQLHLLGKLLNQYMTVGVEYMLARHIIYNIREHGDKQDMSDDREEFNDELQEELENGANKFQKVMMDCTTEYFLCDPAQPTDPENFFPKVRKENKQGSLECGDIQKSGYQCVPSNKQGNTFRNCDCVKSTMIVKTGMLKADPGYVITGVKMEIHAETLLLTATQAELLHNGQIDETTIKPVEDKHIGKQLYHDFVIKKSQILFGHITIPEGRFMTAVGLQKSHDDFYIGAESTKYDFVENELITGSTRVENYERSNKGTTFSRVVEQEKDSSGKVTEYKWSDRMYPLIDTQSVETPTPTPLSGVGFFLRGTSEKDGFLAIKINTFNSSPHMAKIPPLNELPIQTILMSFSNRTALLELEKSGKM